MARPPSEDAQFHQNRHEWWSREGRRRFFEQQAKKPRQPVPDAYSLSAGADYERYSIDYERTQRTREFMSQKGSSRRLSPIEAQNARRPTIEDLRARIGPFRDPFDSYGDLFADEYTSPHGIQLELFDTKPLHRDYRPPAAPGPSVPGDPYASLTEAGEHAQSSARYPVREDEVAKKTAAAVAKRKAAKAATPAPAPAEKLDGASVAADVIDDTHAGGSRVAEVARGAADEARVVASKVKADPPDVGDLVSRVAAPFRGYSQDIKNAGFINATGKAIESGAARLKAAFGHGATGRMATHEVTQLRNVLHHSSETPVASGSMRAARATLDALEDPGQLHKLLLALDPKEANAIYSKTTDPALLVQRYRHVLHGKLNALPKATIAEAHRTGTAAAVGSATPKMNSSAAGVIKNRIARLLSDQTERYGKRWGLSDDAIARRLRSRLFHASHAGTVHMYDAGVPKEQGRMVYDWADQYNLTDVGTWIREQAEYLRNVDRVREPGWANIYGLTLEQVQSMQRRGVQYLGSRVADVSRTVRVEPFKVGAGKEERVVGALMMRLEQPEIATRRELYMRNALSLDIETTFGKETVDEFGAFMQAEGEVTKSQRLQRMVAQKYQNQIAAAVKKGDDLGVEQAWIAANSDIEFDRISQIGMKAVTREKAGYSNWRTQSVIAKGTQNTGLRAGQALTDDEFAGAIDALGEQLVKLHDRNGQRTGSLVGLNVAAFDLKKIRYDAWMAGEAAHAKANRLQREMALVRKQGGRTSMQYRDLADEAAAARKRADILLGYSGRWQGEEQGWVAYKSAAARRWVRGTKIKAEHAGAGMAERVAHDVQKTFRAQVAGASEGWYANTTELEQRVRAVYFGASEGQVIGEGATAVRVRRSVLGRSQQIFNSDLETDEILKLARPAKLDHTAKRITKVTKALSEREFNDYLLKGLGPDDQRVADALQTVLQAKGDNLNDALKGLNRKDIARLNQVLDNARDAWGNTQVEHIVNEKVLRTRVSQERILFGRRRVFDLFINRAQVTDEAGRDLSMVEAGAHGVVHDIEVPLLGEAEARATVLKTGEEMLGSMELTAEDEKMLRGVRLTIAGIGGSIENRWAGAKARMISTISSTVKLFDEGITEEDISAVSATLGDYAGRIGSAVDRMYGHALGDAVGAVTRTAAEVFPAGHWATNPEVVSSIARRGLTGVAVVGIGAAAVLAGTTLTKRHEDDDVWRYAPAENSGERYARLRERQQDLTMGQLPLETSRRRRNHHNMRPDRHNHLFNGG